MNRYLYPTYKRSPVKYDIRVGDRIRVSKDAVENYANAPGARAMPLRSVVGVLTEIFGPERVLNYGVTLDGETFVRAWGREHIEHE